MKNQFSCCYNTQRLISADVKKDVNTGVSFTVNVSIIPLRK